MSASSVDAADETISIAVEVVLRSDWTDQVFLSEIKGKKETLYMKPSYASVDLPLARMRVVEG